MITPEQLADQLQIELPPTVQLLAEIIAKTPIPTAYVALNLILQRYRTAMAESAVRQGFEPADGFQALDHVVREVLVNMPEFKLMTMN